jgi:hypothetical protein
VPRALQTRAGRAAAKQVLVPGARRSARVIHRICRASAKCRGFVSQRLTEMGSFRRGVSDCRARQLARHGFGEPVAPGIWPISGFSRRALPEYRGFVSRRESEMGSFRQGVTDYHWVRFAAALEIGFVSSGRYRLPLGSFCSGARNGVRFVRALQIAIGFVSRRESELGSFRQGVTECHWVRFAARVGNGFVSSGRYRLPLGSFCRRHSVRSGRSTRRCRLPWLRFVSGIRFVRGIDEALQITVASFRQRRRSASRKAPPR